MESITIEREWNIVATVSNQDRLDKIVLAINQETAQDILQLFRYQDKHMNSSIADSIQTGTSFKNTLDEVIRLRQQLDDSPLNEFFDNIIKFTEVKFQNKSLSDELKMEAKKMKRENKMHFFPYRHTVSEYTELLDPFQIYHRSEPSRKDIHCFTNSLKILGLEEEKLMILNETIKSYVTFRDVGKFARLLGINIKVKLNTFRKISVQGDIKYPFY